MKTIPSTPKWITLSRIAKTALYLPTLATRNMDSLDFSNQAVWGIAEALDAAYEAGRAAERSRQLAIIDKNLAIGQ